MNELRNNNYIVTFDKLKNVAFYANDIPIPGVSLGEAIVNTRTLDISVPSDKLQFDPLTITFNVDENLVNYLEIFNWMMDLGHPDRSQVTRPSDKDAVSDMTVTIVNNQKNPIMTINFKDCFPITLGELPMNIQASEPVLCNLTMKYSWFDIVNLGE